MKHLQNNYVLYALAITTLLTNVCYLLISLYADAIMRYVWTVLAWFVIFGTLMLIGRALVRGKAPHGRTE